MTVRAGVERDLAAWERRQPGISVSGLASSALALAAQMDDPGTKATAMANCANSLAQVLARIEEGLPAEVTEDDLDDLAARRARRLAG